MKVEVVIDDTIQEPKVVVYVKEINPETNNLVESLKSNDSFKIIGTLDDRKFILNKKIKRKK